MVKKSSHRKRAPLASFESLISLESCPEENIISSGRWPENLQPDLDLDLASLPWTSPSWQKMSVSRQNCQVYQVNFSLH